MILYFVKILLVDGVKLFYTVNTYKLNSIKNKFVYNNINIVLFTMGYFYNLIIKILI